MVGGGRVGRVEAGCEIHGRGRRRWRWLAVQRLSRHLALGMAAPVAQRDGEHEWPVILASIQPRLAVGSVHTHSKNRERAVLVPALTPGQSKAMPAGIWFRATPGSWSGVSRSLSMACSGPGEEGVGGAGTSRKCPHHEVVGGVSKTSVSGVPVGSESTDELDGLDGDSRSEGRPRLDAGDPSRRLLSRSCARRNVRAMDWLAWRAVSAITCARVEQG